MDQDRKKKILALFFAFIMVMWMVAYAAVFL